MINSGEFLRCGHRTPTDWLASSTGESIGHCRSTITLATTLPHLPLVAAAFGAGALAESAVRLLVEAWHPDIADAVAGDEEMLIRWARQMPHRDFKVLVEAWQMHADPDRDQRGAADRYDKRRRKRTGCRAVRKRVIIVGNGAVRTADLCTVLRSLRC